jgi:hypothetical protein
MRVNNWQSQLVHLVLASVSLTVAGMTALALGLSPVPRDNQERGRGEFIVPLGGVR